MNDRRHHEEQLAAWADQALKQLPKRRAPATLAPRVLAALAKQRSLPWHRQPWLNWPRHLQVLSFLFFAGAVGAVAWFLLPHADILSFASAKHSLAHTEGLKFVSTTMQILSTLGEAILTILRYMNIWVWAALLGSFGFLYCSCLGLGTACWRLAGNDR